MKPVRHCPVCEGRHVVPENSCQPENLLRCCKCGLIFERRVPSDQELLAHYGQYRYGTLKPCSLATRASFQQVLQSLEPWRGKGRLLDLGCGQGDFLVEALTMNWQVTGMEFSDAAVSLCSARGLQVIPGSSAASALSGQLFDVITAFEVLEHLRTPGELLKDASLLLQQGGLFYITTPNFNALLRHLEKENFAPISYPDHLCLFTPASLRKLACFHGFRVVSLQTTGLDPWRLKACLRVNRARKDPNPTELQAVKDARSRFRETLHSSRRMAFVKASINALVNAFGVGDALKVWLVKL